MLLQVKTSSLINKPKLALFGALFAAVLALLPISAGAQCSIGWDAGGRHGVRQRGMRYGFTLELQQKGRVVTGIAYGVIDNRSGGVDKLEGTVDGTLDGDNFNVQIFWRNGQTGVYNATVLPSGRLDGQGHEKNSPNVRVPWNSEGVLRCPPPPPKPLRSSGKAKPTSTPAPPTPPFITASQAIIPTLGHPFGIVTLSWDGGPDHPNVEVRLAEGDTPAFSLEFPAGHQLFKQQKSAGMHKLPRGRSYTFVLKAGGKTLSTASSVYVP